MTYELAVGCIQYADERVSCRHLEAYGYLLQFWRRRLFETTYDFMSFYVLLDDIFYIYYEYD